MHIQVAHMLTGFSGYALTPLMKVKPTTHSMDDIAGDKLARVLSQIYPCCIVLHYTVGLRWCRLLVSWRRGCTLQVHVFGWWVGVKGSAWPDSSHTLRTQDTQEVHRDRQEPANDTKHLAYVYKKAALHWTTDIYIHIYIYILTIFS